MNVEKGNAVSIKKGLHVKINDIFGEQWVDKFVGMGTDGASVMQGKKGGVVALFRQELQKPYIQAIHCNAHKLELAYKDGAKTVLLFQNVDSLLLNLYYFYKKSPLNRSMLKRSFNSSGIKRTRLPTRVGGTRWLPHIQRALENLLFGYKPVMQHLEQVKQSNLGESSFIKTS